MLSWLALNHHFIFYYDTLNRHGLWIGRRDIVEIFAEWGKLLMNEFERRLVLLIIFQFTYSVQASCFQPVPTKTALAVKIHLKQNPVQNVILITICPRLQIPIQISHNV